MSQNPVCRICLAVYMRLIPIAGTPLQFLYEKLVDTSLYTSDNRPLEVCYICHALLNKCQNLRVTATKAENVLSSILEEYPKGSTELDSLIGDHANDLSTSLTTIPVECTDITSFSTPIFVKSELLNEKDKDELVCDVKDEMECDAVEDFPEVPLIQSSDIEDESSLAELDEDALIMENMGPVLKSARVMLTPVFDIPKTDVHLSAFQPSNAQPSGSDVESWIKSEVDDTPAPAAPLHSRRTDRKSAVCAIKSKPKTEKHSSKDEDGRHVCDVCCSRFRRLSDLGKHKIIHKSEKPYECNDCQRRFSGKSHLIRHIKTHADSESYDCNVCQKRFKYAFAYIDHVRTHTGEKPYECSLCEYKSGTVGHLNRHLMTHTGTKPYACDVCQKRFAQKVTLQNHLRIHTGKRSNECNICKKTFGRVSTLQLHLRRHIDKKLHECNKCERRFIDKWELTCHLRTHTDEKPYECNVCHRRFKRQSILRRHLLTHTGVKPFKCNYCPRGFNRKESLHIHIRKKHKETQPQECDI